MEQPMTAELLNILREITTEEQAILDGKREIERELYVSRAGDTFDARKLLEKGKLITVCPPTRGLYIFQLILITMWKLSTCVPVTPDTLSMGMRCVWSRESYCF